MNTILGTIFFILYLVGFCVIVFGVQILIILSLLKYLGA